MTFSLELITAVGGLLLASNGVAIAITRWLSTRSSERRDTLSQVREALQVALERVARVEGRADELSKQNAALHSQLSTERVEAARERAEQSIRIAQLEHERAEQSARIAQLERDLDEALAENARLRGEQPPPRRSPTPPRPIAAQPTDDAPPRR